MKHILRTLLVMSLLVGFSATTVSTVNAADNKEMTAAQKQKAKEKAKKQKEKEKAAAKRAKEQEKAKKEREKASAQRQKEAAKDKTAREKEQAKKQAERDKVNAERAKVQAEREQIAQEKAAAKAKAEAEALAIQEKELAELRAPKVEVEEKKGPEVISYFNLSPRLGYDAMFDNLKDYSAGGSVEAAPLMSKKLTGGVGAGLEMTYQLECNHFLFETGLEFDFFNSKTTYGFVEQRKYFVNTLSSPKTQTHYFLTDNLAETRNMGILQLPIMMGAQFGRYYFLLGARLGYAIPFSYLQKGTYDWLVQDNTYFHQYGNGVIDVPAAKGDFKFNPLAVSGCIELGLDLDEWMQQAPDEKNKPKVKPGERLPFGREHVHYRVALFADYQFLNMNNNSGLPLTFTGNNTTPTGANTIWGINNGMANVTNLFIGGKFTIQFEVPGKTARPVPPQPSYLDLKVENEANQERLNATLELINLKTGKQIIKPMEMKNGQKAQKLAKGNYEIRLAMQDFYPATTTFTIPEDGYLLDTTIALRHRPYFKVRVRNAETLAAMPARVQVRRQKSNVELFALNTDTINGAANTMLQDTILYALHVEMMGFEPLDTLVTDIAADMTLDMIPIKKGEVFIMKNMFFATNKTRILPTSEQSLLELFGFLSRNPEVRIKIMGHTDSVGKDQANQILSEGRATAVRQDLIDRGIAPDRIEAEGYGETRPIDTNDTDEGRQNNRRVEVEIL